MRKEMLDLVNKQLHLCMTTTCLTMKILPKKLLQGLAWPIAKVTSILHKEFMTTLQRDQRESTGADPVYESNRQPDDSVQTGEDKEGELRGVPRRKSP